MRVNQLTLLIISLSYSVSSYSGSYTFDKNFFNNSINSIDLDTIENDIKEPGNYLLDIYLNNKIVDIKEIELKNINNNLIPCLSSEQLEAYGINIKKLGISKTNCADLSKIPYIITNIVFSEQKLNISIPQIYLDNKEKGSIASKSLWNNGINALILNYNAMINNISGNSYNNDSSYIQLSPRVNLGAWRFYNQTNWNKNKSNSGKWENVYNYAERAINSINSRVTLGDSSTPSEIFNSVPFRGVMLAKDDSMIASIQRRFSPTIRGIARTQAIVEVKQNNFTVYKTSVAAGPFELSDFLTTSSNGILEVTVYESDGSEQYFTVPFNKPAIAVKEGYLNYHTMLGEYRPTNSSIDKAAIVQGSAIYGLPWNMTILGGFQGAKNYQSVALGVGSDLGSIGAVSIDAIVSHSQKKNQNTESGAAWRLQYSKALLTTNTMIALSSYQYASPGFNDISNVLDTYQDDNYTTYQTKNYTTLSLIQSFKDLGNFTLSGSKRKFYNNRDETSYSASYWYGWKYASLSLGLVKTSTTRNNKKESDNIFNLQLSIPLEKLTNTDTTLRYQTISNKNGSDSNLIDLTGLAYDRQLNWNISQNIDSDSESNASSLGLGWTGTYGKISGNYNYNKNVTQKGAAISGGFIASENNVTFSQTIGNTAALIDAPYVTGSQINSYPGLRTDFKGNAVLSNLTPYHVNVVSIDPTTLPDNVDLAQTDMKVIPTKGAIINTQFTTRVGERALIDINTRENNKISFGSIVKLESNTNIMGVVNDNSQVYLSGLPEKGTLVLYSSKDQCKINYDLKNKENKNGIYFLTLACQ
ncbi:fimbria/pilus outer membrane usher protein [Proteus vulgaris]|uniref:fimbria/pilus outer membrane usher protein n=1 Tax=Proteus TaxID=583 RepID=UPI0032DB9713